MCVWGGGGVTLTTPGKEGDRNMLTTPRCVCVCVGGGGGYADPLNILCMLEYSTLFWIC